MARHTTIVLLKHGLTQTNYTYAIKIHDIQYIPVSDLLKEILIFAHFFIQFASQVNLGISSEPFHVYFYVDNENNQYFSVNPA